MVRRCAVLLLVCPGAVLGFSLNPEFSVDPASPAIGGALGPDDVLRKGPVVHLAGSVLGLQDNFGAGQYDNLDAFSYGKDPVSNSLFDHPIYFSVTRTAVGAAGSAVADQAKLGSEEAAGDIFKVIGGGNQLYADEAQLGLTPGFFGDDLDAAELDEEIDNLAYFSIDLFSATNNFGAGGKAAEILLTDMNFPGAFVTFAGPGLMGLGVGDDLDALALMDVGTVGQVDPGVDKALFSLSVHSALVLGGGATAGGIYYTDFTGTFVLVGDGVSIGLAPGDDVDALDTVPEPGTVALIAIGLAGLPRRRQRKMGHRGGEDGRLKRT
jgi:hypothetical protein